MFIDVAAGTVSWRDIYRIAIGFVNPRPIALVSTLAENGRPNLAPFSFYNMVCGNPPVVMFSAGIRRDRAEKDTYRNLLHLGEFAVATVTAPLAEKMVACAAELPYGESEFAFAGLTPSAARLVRPPLVREAAVNIECRVRQILTINDAPGGAHVVFGDVVALHVDDSILDAGGSVDPHKLPTVGRLGGKYYADVTRPYEMTIPEPPPP